VEFILFAATSVTGRARKAVRPTGLSEFLSALPQELLPDTFQDPLGPSAKGLVSSEVSPNSAAVSEAHAAVCLSFCEATRYFHWYGGFQLREPFMDLSQKREMRVAVVDAYEKARNRGVGLPRDARAEVVRGQREQAE
jgi:hypothetical protein